MPGIALAVGNAHRFLLLFDRLAAPGSLPTSPPQCCSLSSKELLRVGALVNNRNGDVGQRWLQQYLDVSSPVWKREQIS